MLFPARVSLLLLALGGVVAAPAADPSPHPAWPEVRRENRPWARWWWPGSGVDRAGLTHELDQFAAAGFGGVEITPIYGALGAESRYVSYLSPAWLDLLAHTGREAQRLGLGLDIATGTGWPFGGPQVTPADAELKVAFGPDGQLAPVPTNFKVKRAAPGGEGLVVNPYSATALSHYLAPFTAALATLPAGTVQGQFHDSFEYQANWATEVPEKFIALHGYDLRDHAAALRGEGDPDTVARIKSDYRTTLGALHLDYVKAWTDWAHARGQTARNQAHGSPGNLLDLYAAADIPETEIFGSIPFPIPGFRREAAEIGRPGHPPIIHRFASSAAHVTGKPLASSETFTWLREHFHEAPSEMKPELDELFLAGINHVYFHGSVYSPEDAAWPGWLFYASSQLNSRNPLWRDLGDGLNAYITRTQSLLQSGRPDNDLLVYWPADDLWHNPEGLQIQLTVHASWLESSATGQLMNELTARGYAYDLISDAQLASVTVENKQLKTSGGLYRTILVPPTGHMSVETLHHLLDLASDGATVLFLDSLPADVPGYGRLAERRGQFHAELARLKLKLGNDNFRFAKLGRGQIQVAPATLLLPQLNVSPEPLADHGLRFIRRRLEDGYIYFIANPTGQAFEGWVMLDRDVESAVQMDPRRGGIGVAVLRPNHGGTEIYLQQAPGESFFIRTLTHATFAGEPTHYAHPAGAPLTLDGDWNVTAVRGGPELPPAFHQHGFGSWTAQGGEWERFAGTARFELEFTLPPDAKADDWLLDLGDVRETARVFVNGQEADLIWSLPARTKIGTFLHPGKNTLALEVTNLAANRIRDLDRRGVKWKIMREINFVNINYKSFDASGWALTPSGLLGPITLTPLHFIDPTTHP